jgi:hypothetical protein
MEQIEEKGRRRWESLRKGSKVEIYVSTCSPTLLEIYLTMWFKMADNQNKITEKLLCVWNHNPSKSIMLSFISCNVFLSCFQFQTKTVVLFLFVDVMDEAAKWKRILLVGENYSN